mmetsp:Transcript_56132/g.168028  ORF Transcript_56132/g.168028 Transcript_56132/m.168028 type:complete len:221 (-) Transcript_56132:186-848(-)|eukprot:CAMPEP_0113548880 /NCGR_PEP_ID=MMETSP0015_2-20120614/13130_1 /TAXON_ID=2838 /ORGANISM="Odontella" /LENGTH=220 /DNA_ID=CAMNT_0000449541 /DNA_START=169 /DNA_END=831 /DNA_ORIENTATION=- /assembly_acc=CAM_ASM_000160
MGGTFSSSSSKKTPKRPPGGTISDIDRAVLDLKNARDRLQRYRAKLEQDEKKLLERARTYKAEGNEKSALGLLKVRRHKIKEVDNVNNQLLTVTEMVDTIASKENEKEVLGAMRTGKDALKALHDEMSIDDVLNLMDEVQEESQIEAEINDILKQGVGFDSADELEVERELAELEKELAGEVGKEEAPSMPDVPTSTLPEVKKQEEKVEEKRPARVAVAS